MRSDQVGELASEVLKTQPVIRSPPPLLCEHTDEVLQEVLGYNEERINELKTEELLDDYYIYLELTIQLKKKYTWHIN